MTGSPAPGSRDSWGTRAGFILAAIGSAVGLGNMLRFAYIASEGGGAAFVVLYLLIVAFVGIPLMTSEFIVGRMAQQSPAEALRRFGGPAWAPLGWLFVFCAFGILSYYSVIAGWTMRYALDAIRNAIPSDTAGYFGAISAGRNAVLFHIIFMAMTIFIVARGVKGGLEKANLVFMPALFFILLSLAIWASTLDGGAAGYAFYLKPQISELFRADILADAAGQAFFSLSLGMGAMMTYASYLKSQENLGREATVISLSDFGVAFMAGLVVFPVVFAFGLSDQISESTVGALFIALPKGFEALGRTGDFVDTAFFVMLFFAAITSAISLLEVAVAAVVDRGGRWSRGQIAVVIGILITLLGIPSAYNTNLLGALDQLVGNFLLIVGGFFTALLVGYKLLPQADTELARGLPSAGARKGWAVLVRYVVPVVLIGVIISAAPATWDAVKTILGMGQ